MLTRKLHMLVWCGLRGASASALPLGLPKSIPYHDEIVKVAFTVAAFSIFSQGLTMTPMLRRMGGIAKNTGLNPPL
jgi:CPA1 family monovalent cation:H+ antiporter